MKLNPDCNKMQPGFINFYFKKPDLRQLDITRIFESIVDILYYTFI